MINSDAEIEKNFRQGLQRINIVLYSYSTNYTEYKKGVSGLNKERRYYRVMYMATSYTFIS